MTAVIALGAGGCGSGDSGGEAAPAGSPSPRPTGTGPLTEDTIRADLDAATADAGAPANDPGYADDWQIACSLAYKGFGTRATVDAARFKATVTELREREWRQSKEHHFTERKDEDGRIYEARTVLKQRGWTLVTEYRAWGKKGVITMVAFEDACKTKDGQFGFRSRVPEDWAI
ncbi:hypothetical protein ACIPJS_38055 [Streptomyces sp. NPDC086783]|uniref:hypothetical protein n=1 Tax=Streptomyces sp. NPDC086783 TaxID=3365758 RepID=UPI003814753C